MWFSLSNFMRLLCREHVRRVLRDREGLSKKEEEKEKEEGEEC